MDINLLIDQLISYAIKEKLITPRDTCWAINQLMALLQIDEYSPSKYSGKLPTYPTIILEKLCNFAAKKGLISPDTITMRDLFDSKIMGVFTNRPSNTIENFWNLYQSSPKKATSKFYHDAKCLNYIRTDRIAKNKYWKTSTKYGSLEITINLSKPEKDPKDIAATLNAKNSSYPLCLLCKENQGYFGRINHPARQNLQLIPLDLLKDKSPWFFQYSPYVYYNEHCICLSGTHEPMKLTKKSFARLLNFVEIFPHYFIGSNADLPIVGGSILTHDHFQGGRHQFAMEKAPIERFFKLSKFPRIKAGIVKWPMSVIRLIGNKKDLIESSFYILQKWRKYSDLQAGIISQDNFVLHNTITPIVRRQNKKFEIDLVLRNNRTSTDFPLGVFHPHPDVHHIKKENIGLIEVMGLAVLPARLEKELNELSHLLIIKDLKSIKNNKTLNKHYLWAKDMIGKYQFTTNNVHSILKKEIGSIFTRVLEDAGVYKRTKEGQEAFDRFINEII